MMDSLHPMVWMLSAHIWVVWCHGTRQRTSSSVHAMVPSTATRAVLFVVLLPWYLHSSPFLPNFFCNLGLLHAQCCMLLHLQWCRDLKDLMGWGELFTVLFAVIGFSTCGCRRRQSAVFTMDRNWLQDRREPMVVIGTCIFSSRIGNCHWSMHGNLVNHFPEWWWITCTSLWSLYSSHDPSILIPKHS